MCLRRDADGAERQDEAGFVIDPRLHKFDGVSGLDAKLGQQPIRPHDLRPAAAVVPERIRISISRFRRLEREQRMHRVVQDQDRLRRADPFVRYPAHRDRPAGGHRHIKPRPMRRHISPRQDLPIKFHKTPVATRLQT